MNVQSSFSTSELFAYVTGWTLLMGSITSQMNSPAWTSFSMLMLLVLPGLLLGGTVGFVIGGRKLFWPAGVCCASLWILANVIPIVVLNFSR